MPRFYRNSLICFLVLTIPAVGNTSGDRQYDADAIVSMRNGNPCFSYPQDNEIRKRQYAFNSLGVSRVSVGAAWQIQATSYDRKGLLEPKSPESCVEYGILNPGMKIYQTAESLQFDTPYSVHIHVGPSPEIIGNYERDFRSYFCISRNEKGETIVVEASGEGKGAWHCLKPGESKKRGFWGWLFGK